MIDLRDFNAKQLDTVRKISGPAGGAELKFLKPGQVRGYDVIFVVRDGWCVEDSDVGGFQTLLVAETDRTTAEVLDDVRLFAIDSAMYSVEGETRKIRPTPGAKMPSWKFIISPTSETL